MNRKKFQALLVFILAFFAAGCGYSKEEQVKEQAFLALYPKVVMTQKLVIKFAKVSQPPKVDQVVNLMIVNKSTDGIQIAYDQVELWEYEPEEGEWLRITNGMNYLSDKPISLSPDPNQLKIVSVYP